MIKVEFFGNYRLDLKTAEIEIQANTIREMFDEIEKRFPDVNRKDIEKALLFVNDKAETGIFRKNTKLKDGDRVLMMYPSCGG